VGIGNLHIAIGFLQLEIPLFSLWAVLLLLGYTIFTAPFMFYHTCLADVPKRHNNAYTTILYLLGLMSLFCYVGFMNFNLTTLGYPSISSLPHDLLPQIILVEPGGIIGLLLIFLGYLSVFDHLFAKPLTDNKPRALCVLAGFGLFAGFALLVLVFLYEGLNTLHFYYYMLGLFVLYIFLKYREQLLGKILESLGIFLTFFTLFLPAIILPMGGLPNLLPQQSIYQTIFIVLPTFLLLLYLWKGRHCKKLNTYLAAIGLFGLTSMALFIYLYQDNFNYIYAFCFYAVIVSLTYFIWRCCFNYFDGKSDVTHASKSLLATWLFVLVASYISIEFFIMHPYYDIINQLNRHQASQTIIIDNQMIINKNES
tara:strand:+ start:2159 stop:3262 length:1104 start_codon:yes stop_codon:yes gene_type:complete